MKIGKIAFSKTNGTWPILFLVWLPPVMVSVACMIHHFFRYSLAGKIFNKTLNLFQLPSSSGKKLPSVQMSQEIKYTFNFLQLSVMLSLSNRSKLLSISHLSTEPNVKNEHNVDFPCGIHEQIRKW